MKMIRRKFLQLMSAAGVFGVSVNVEGKAADLTRLPDFTKAPSIWLNGEAISPSIVERMHVDVNNNRRSIELSATLLDWSFLPMIDEHMREEKPINVKVCFAGTTNERLQYQGQVVQSSYSTDGSCSFTIALLQTATTLFDAPDHGCFSRAIRFN